MNDKLPIPVACDRIREIAGAMLFDGLDPEAAALELLGLLPRMTRNRLFPAKRWISRAVTLEIAREVWRLYGTGLYTQDEIGHLLRIDGGRVCEVLHGQRFPEARP